MTISIINTLQLGIGFKFCDSITLISRGLACLIFSLISMWQLSIVFIFISIAMSASSALMVTYIKKYTIKEFKAYGEAGIKAQEVLSSIRTVYALGLENREINEYRERLNNAETMNIKKGAIAGFFSGLASMLYNIMFSIEVYFAMYLINSDPVDNTPGKVIRSFFSLITTTFAISQALPFIKDLAEGKFLLFLLFLNLIFQINI